MDYGISFENFMGLKCLRINLTDLIKAERQYKIKTIPQNTVAYHLKYFLFISPLRLEK